MLNRLVRPRMILLCLLALAVLGFRAPSPDFSSVQDTSMAAHDHHGHSHDDDDEPVSWSGHDHDRFHVGDHSHETPNAAPTLVIELTGLKDSTARSPNARVASLPTPPGDRPPRRA
jgi:hypothetical protein